MAWVYHEGLFLDWQTKAQGRPRLVRLELLKFADYGHLFTGHELGRQVLFESREAAIHALFVGGFQVNVDRADVIHLRLDNEARDNDRLVLPFLGGRVLILAPL